MKKRKQVLSDLSSVVMNGYNISPIISREKDGRIYSRKVIQRNRVSCGDDALEWVDKYSLDNPFSVICGHNGVFSLTVDIHLEKPRKVLIAEIKKRYRNTIFVRCGSVWHFLFVAMGDLLKIKKAESDVYTVTKNASSVRLGGSGTLVPVFGRNAQTGEAVSPSKRNVTNVSTHNLDRLDLEDIKSIFRLFRRFYEKLSPSNFKQAAFFLTS